MNYLLEFLIGLVSLFLLPVFTYIFEKLLQRHAVLHLEICWLCCMREIIQGDNICEVAHQKGEGLWIWWQVEYFIIFKMTPYSLKLINAIRSLRCFKMKYCWKFWFGLVSLFLLPVFTSIFWKNSAAKTCCIKLWV